MSNNSSLTKNLKSKLKLIDPRPDFNMYIGKLGDALLKKVEEPLGYAINWGRLYSLWPVHLETGCCSVELGAASSPRYDLERFGVLEAFGDRKSTRLNSSHANISYAVFCLKKKNKSEHKTRLN